MSPYEEWRDVVGFEGFYKVSNMGRVMALARVVHYPDGRKSYVVAARYMRTPINNSGYPVVQLNKDGRYKNKLVHVLMLEAFVGPAPKGMIARHMDSDPANCRLSNVRWGTRSENEGDKVANGTSNRGERHGMAKLTDSQVTEIRRHLADGESCARLAVDNGVGRGQIWRIKRGIRRSEHVT